MKTILVAFMFITITTCGTIKDEDKSEISTEIPYDNTTMVPAIDNNEGSSTTENDEAAAEIHKGDITQVEDQNIKTANDSDNITTTNDVGESIRRIKETIRNEMIVDHNVLSRNLIYNPALERTSFFVGSACLPGQGRADDGTVNFRSVVTVL
ncbi:hypothetical protein B5X24_HaOG204173 [Helicoverpa armigera]|uniref:Uncharacterized protein n=1 Tax=Helicoverpa armigera TaxID=29058 RepID=A0A2W1BNU6_HELAM|nr:hypothetical protein B5X24_HaOG204173 [Helicoverpa armigera]